MSTLDLYEVTSVGPSEVRRYLSNTLHGTAIYAAPLTPQTTPTDRQSYGSPMECLGMALWVPEQTCSFGAADPTAFDEQGANQA